MFILTIVMIGYDFGMSIFSIPKIEESIYSLEEKNAKTLMSKIVSISNNVHTDIEFFKRAALELHKKNLKEINSIAYSVLQSSYARYISGELSEDEAKKAIEDAGIKTNVNELTMLPSSTVKIEKEKDRY